MAGTWWDTADKNNYVYVKDWRAYEEGAQYRLGGTALERPSTDNPFADGTPENVAWATGWTDAHGDGAGANGTIDQMSAYRGQTAPA